MSVTIVDGPITIPHRSTAAGAGACLTFLGVVRPTERQRPIAGLRYEVYQPMAENVLRRLCEAACERFALLSAELVHSRGRVPVGEASLSITVSSEHRSAAIEALAWLIEGLKRDVPIWKSPEFCGEQ